MGEIYSVGRIYLISEIYSVGEIYLVKYTQ